MSNHLVWFTFGLLLHITIFWRDFHPKSDQTLSLWCFSRRLAWQLLDGPLRLSTWDQVPLKVVTFSNFFTQYGLKCGHGEWSNFPTLQKKSPSCGQMIMLVYAFFLGFHDVSWFLESFQRSILWVVGRCNKIPSMENLKLEKWMLSTTDFQDACHCKEQNKRKCMNMTCQILYCKTFLENWRWRFDHVKFHWVVCNSLSNMLERTLFQSCGSLSNYNRFEKLRNKRCVDVTVGKLRNHVGPEIGDNQILESHWSQNCTHAQRCFSCLKFDVMFFVKSDPYVWCWTTPPGRWWICGPSKNKRWTYVQVLFYTVRTRSQINMNQYKANTKNMKLLIQKKTRWHWHENCWGSWFPVFEAKHKLWTTTLYWKCALFAMVSDVNELILTSLFKPLIRLLMHSDFAKKLHMLIDCRINFANFRWLQASFRGRNSSRACPLESRRPIALSMPFFKFHETPGDGWGKQVICIASCPRVLQIWKVIDVMCISNGSLEIENGPV